MQFSKVILFLILSLVISAKCTNAQNLNQNQIYKAYTKTYGYVRFFHPSDEVLNLKDNKFAYYGVQKLQNITTIQALKDSLTKIFKPIAPSIQFYLKGEQPQAFPTYANKDSLQLVFWQHRGLGLGNFYDKQQYIYKSVRINSWKDTIFSTYPKENECIEEEIAPNLFCKIPLTLYKDNIGTLPRTDTVVYNNIKKSLENIVVGNLTANDINIRLANIVIFWNTINYFYPYFEEVGLNWNNELDNVLVQAQQPQTELEFLKLLQRTISKLQDAHTWVSFPKIGGSFKFFPFRASWIKNKFLITVSNDSLFKVGDEILALGGKDIKTVSKEVEKIIGGSTYLKTARCGQGNLGIGEANSNEKITLKRKNKGKTKVLNILVSRNVEYVSEIPKPSREIEKGIFYINLTEDSLAYLKTFLPRLQKAKGVIIEMRGYPNDDNLDFLGYLSPKPLQCAKWNVPKVINSAIKSIEYDTSGRWEIEPQKEQITCKKVFLTNANAQSQAETFMGIVEHYKLGEIIGQPTAGCNGNIAGFGLLGGYWFAFTGMKVLKHDGSQHHLIGIKPTIPITYSEKDILEGRDLEMEKALEILRK